MEVGAPLTHARALPRVATAPIAVAALVALVQRDPHRARLAPCDAGLLPR